jgi:hypothetical protein
MAGADSFRDKGNVNRHKMKWSSVKNTKFLFAISSASPKYVSNAQLSPALAQLCLKVSQLVPWLSQLLEKVSQLTPRLSRLSQLVASIIETPELKMENPP